jgi:hypothetical protein
MYSPKPVRKDVRYPLHLPVLVRSKGGEIHAQSENISLHGILLSSASQITGPAVQLEITVRSAPHRTVLIGQGKVLRVELKAAGDFSVAIACEYPFRLKRQNSSSGSAIWHQQSSGSA